MSKQSEQAKHMAARESVIAAVAGDYAERFWQHIRLHQALLAG